MTTQPTRSGTWHKDEHQRYLDALGLYGERYKANWKAITTLVGTRSRRQVVSHHQKIMKKLERRKKRSDSSSDADETAMREEHKLPDIELLERGKDKRANDRDDANASGEGQTSGDSDATLTPEPLPMDEQLSTVDGFQFEPLPAEEVEKLFLLEPSDFPDANSESESVI